MHDVRLVFHGEQSDEKTPTGQLLGVFGEGMLKGSFDLLLQLGDAIGEERGEQRRRKDERVEKSREEKDRDDDAQEKKNEGEPIAETSARDRSENFNALFAAQPLNVPTIGESEVSNGVRHPARFTLPQATASNFHDLKEESVSFNSTL